MFKIIDAEFKSDTYGIESYLNNWPMLYILENGKKAYVGQTNNINKRMAQHKMSPAKQAFDKVHFIYSDKFNQSATFDYESRLISLMAADEQFVLTNLNAGLSGLDYYDKAFYDTEFRNLWEQLRNKRLVKKTIDELQQSDLFKYSPYKELNAEQRKLVAEIVDNLKKDLNRRIVVNGMPGSGKTITAIYLFKLLRESPEFKDLKIAMVVPPTSLRDTIKNVFQSINNLSKKDVIGPNEVAEQQYDILLVDEAHRLKKRMNLSDYKSYDQACENLGLDNDSTQLDWILKQSKNVILFYDKNQIVFPAGLQIDVEINKNRYDTRALQYYFLLSQLRCSGGTEYLEDIDKLLNLKLKQHVRAENYELRIVDNFTDFNSLCYEKEAEAGLTRMVAGYAWEWKSKKDKTAIDIEIEGCSKQWNSCLKNWVHSKNAQNEVGCIHSTQGYDLNYGFVIIGKDLKYDGKRIYADANNYFDRYGKIGTTEEELNEYVKNIYYVLMTRGIKGTYLYICDDELRNYMKQFIDSI